MAGEAGAALVALVGRIVVINLPARADRRRQVAAELGRLGLGLDHPAVTLFPAIRPDAAGPFPSVGARGCFLSHRAVLGLIAARGWERALILEDDAAFPADAAARLAAVGRAAAGQGWGMLYGFAPEAASGPGPLLALDPATGVMRTHFVAFRGPVAAAAAGYLDAIAARPPGDPRGGPMHVDGAYSWFRRDHPEVQALAARPPLALQRPSRSDIAGPRWFDRLPLLSGAAAALRRLRRPGPG